jgi:uncharacterized protein with GYD domain
MAHYLLRLALTPETFKRFITSPEDRRKAAAKVIEAHGGTLHNYFFAFGKHDVICLVEYPSNVDASAAMMTVASSGAFSGGETTVLLTVDEAVEAMRRAGAKAGVYRAPGQAKGGRGKK